MFKRLALLIAVVAAVPACYAQGNSDAPSEVGQTSMPAGQYLVTEQNTGKKYNLTVTNKGTMILAPAAGAIAGQVSTTATAGASGATANVAGAAQQHSAASDLVKGLAKQGMQKGVNELLRSGTTKQIEKYIK